MRGVVVVLLSIMLFVSFIPFSSAYEGKASDYLRDIGQKLGRGLVNVLTSPAEIPCTISDEMKEGGDRFFIGLGRGTLFMLRRILVGTTEVGTFIIPMERTIPPVCQSESPAQVL